MKAWIGRSDSPAAGRGVSAEAADGGAWVRLGREMIVLAGDGDGDSGASRASGDPAFGEPIEVTDLRLVTQLGNLFRRDHPDVPVVLDKGRYLVVDVGGREIPASDPTCWSIGPLPLGTAVYEERDRSATRRAPSGPVQELVDLVDIEELRTTLKRLADLGTRHSTSPQFSTALGWAEDQLRNLGYVTRREAITVRGDPCQNLVADKAGVGAEPRRLVIVVAHLDSVNVAGANEPAPGADDNGSGSGGLLEIARVLRDRSFTNDLRFVLFGGEEQGLHGSQQHVAALSPTERARIAAVLNMDMVAGLNTPKPTVLIEGSTDFKDLIDAVLDAAVTYTSLEVQTSTNPFNSDHVSFLDADIPAVLTIEGVDSANTRVHTADDTLEHVDHELAREIVRMNVAAAATALQLTAAVPPAQPVPQPPVPAPVPVAAQLSGRYTGNGGAGDRRDDGAGGRRLTPAERSNPVYALAQPVYINESPATPAPASRGQDPGFTLHIDIDGTDPLDVVSGYVASGQQGVPPPHFIGRVSSDSPAGSARAVVVEDFRFTWPGSTDEVDRLELEISAPAGVPPSADVTFVATAPNRRFGPYRATQQSTFFREVQVEVDTEAQALPVEPYLTTTHPVRPSSDPAESLTLEGAFAKAGISIVRSPHGNVIETATAGANRRWNEQELHDAMESHWSAFANVAQWKMWIFVAELADSDGLGGIMFDGDINEPGGVDRQGTAIFTKCPHFHTAGGAYPKANPPAAEAAQRELFFNLMHETGHAFNLAHSFQKALGQGWQAPPWMPLDDVPQSLSWMNYPDEASPGGGASAVWFYERFGWRFDDGENLFLRHTPSEFIEMGNETWFENHGRVTRGSVDPRLELIVRSRSDTVEFGEAVFVELRLRNVSDEPVVAHRNLYPSSGLVELAVTNPAGQRRPWVPIAHTREVIRREILPAGEAFYQELNMTMGQLGFPFKEPGPYRIEASYRNIDGGTAAAVMQLHVRPPSSYDDRRALSTLFDARVGRVLQLGGSKVMEDANEKVEWVTQRLGEEHPAAFYLDAVRAVPQAQPYKLLAGDAREVKVVAENPDEVYQRLQPLIDQPDKAADAVGHIVYRRFVDMYSESAAALDRGPEAGEAQSRLLELFRRRNVVQPVVEEVARKVRELS